MPGRGAEECVTHPFLQRPGTELDGRGLTASYYPGGRNDARVVFRKIAMPGTRGQTGGNDPRHVLNARQYPVVPHHLRGQLA